MSILKFYAQLSWTLKSFRTSEPLHSHQSKKRGKDQESIQPSTTSDFIWPFFTALYGSHSTYTNDLYFPNFMYFRHYFHNSNKIFSPLTTPYLVQGDCKARINTNMYITKPGQPPPPHTHLLPHSQQPLLPSDCSCLFEGGNCLSCCWFIVYCDS